MLAASSSPCAGKYMDMYVGCMEMWIVSKWVHMAGVGFVSRPCANVSAASRKLKSSGTNGRGIGQAGRMARRRKNAVRPTLITARPCLCANRPNTRSMRENQAAPSRGPAKANPTAIRVRPLSINSRLGRLLGSVANSISFLFYAAALRERLWIVIR